MQLELPFRTSHRSRALVTLAALTVLLGAVATARADVQPGPVDVGQAELGKRGPEIPLWFTNPAKLPITMAATRFEGPDAADFTVRGDGCEGRILQPGEKCFALVDFRPRAGGVRRARVVFSQTGETGVREGIMVTGTGLEIVPLHVDFGKRPILGPPTQRVIRYSNHGYTAIQLAKPRLETDADSGFTLGPDDCARPVQSGGSCAVTVAFAPTSGGAKRARLVFRSAAGVTVWTRTEIVGEGAASFDRDSITFGAEFLAEQSAAEAVVFTNLSDERVKAPEPTLTGAAADQFKLVEDGCSRRSIEPGGACTVRVTFVPTSAGRKVAALRFDGLAGARSGVSIALAGLARVPEEASTTRSFGFQALVQSPVVQTLRYRNATRGVMAMHAARIAGADAADFAVREDRCVGRQLAPDATCDVTVAFAPASEGSKHASLIFASPVAARSATVLLAGDAVNPVEPRLVEYSKTAVGATGNVRELHVTNPTARPLPLGSVTVEGADAREFQVGANGCEHTTVPPGGSCSVAVEFRPSSAGAKRAIVRFGAPGVDRPPLVAGLNGVGVGVETVDVAPLDLGEHTIGARAATTSQFTLTSRLDGTISFASPRLDGADGADFRACSDRCGPAPGTGTLVDAEHDVALLARAHTNSSPLCSELVRGRKAL